MYNVDSGVADNGTEDKQGKAHMELYDWVQCIVTALVCCVLLFVFVGRSIGVDGGSMLQTLHNNDRVIMSNLFYTPAGGDIVVFRSPSEKFEGIPLVKRVIATAGQTIDIIFDTGEVYVNGVLQNEPYIYTMTTSRHDFEGPIVIPDGYVFVMGDNRASSTDSRDNDVGLVDTRYILGKVLFLLIPGTDDSGIRDWGRFGLTG
jgi:signal peptidase I